MKILSITELRQEIGDVSTALIRGETIVLTRNGDEIARIVPTHPSKEQEEHENPSN